MELLESLSSIYSWDNDPWDLFPGYDSINVVEIQKHAGGATHFTTRKLVRSAEIYAWLQQSPAPGSDRPVSTTKLLLLAISDERSNRLQPDELQRKKDALRAAMKSFCIPLAALAHTVGWVPGFLKFPAASQPAGMTAYGIFQLKLNMAWTHAADQSTTNGVIWYEERGSPLSRMLLELERLKDFVDQPMFLGLSSCVITTSRLAVERRNILKSVQQAEIQIGMKRGYEYLGENPWDGIPVNYAELSSLVAEASILRTDLCGRLSAVSNVAAQVIAENSILSGATQQQRPIPPSGHRTESMNEILQLVRNHADELLAHANRLEGRMGVQMNRILSLIAQEDQRFNSIIAQDSRVLAIESKRDSKSMQILAVVTTAFLPGTFVASLFAMPLFRWDANTGNDVVNHRFWIYWAVAIPLTFLTFCAWLLWFKFEATQERREDAIALTQMPAVSGKASELKRLRHRFSAPHNKTLVPTA